MQLFVRIFYSYEFCIWKKKEKIKKKRFSNNFNSAATIANEKNSAKFFHNNWLKKICSNSYFEKFYGNRVQHVFSVSIVKKCLESIYQTLF